MKNSAGEYTGFYCMGHAGFARKRRGATELDILCSAISMITINTINALDELAKIPLEVATNEETGFIKCDFKNPLQGEGVILMRAFELGVLNLQEEYGHQYVKVDFQEVEKC